MVKMTAVIKANKVKTVVMLHVKATMDRLSVKKPPHSEGVMMVVVVVVVVFVVGRGVRNEKIGRSIDRSIDGLLWIKIQ